MELCFALPEQYIVEEAVRNPICSEKDRELPCWVEEQGLLIIISANIIISREG